MADPGIFCAYDKLVKLDDLVEHPDNPNTHPKKQVDKLSRLIDAVGWRLPICVSNLSGFVIRGHGRLAAARILGVKVAPVDFQDYQSRDEEIADLVADNTIPELAHIDDKLLAVLVKEIDTGDLIDTEMLGLSEKKIDSLLQEIQADLEIDEPEIVFSEELHESSNYIVLTFKNEIDWLQAQTVFGLETVHSLDSKKTFEHKGIGRVIDGVTAINKLNGGIR